MAGVRPSMAAYVRHRGGSRVRKQTTIGLACSRRDARLRGAARLTNSERGFCWTLCFLSSCQLYPSLAKPIPAWLAAPKARLLKNLYFLVVCQKPLLLLARCRLYGRRGASSESSAASFDLFSDTVPKMSRVSLRTFCCSLFQARSS